MKLSIVIVSYNTRELLVDCINSIEKNLNKYSYEIIVVDNASADGSAVLLGEKYPNIKLIENFYNAGFAKANNQGLAVSSGEYILLLNSDTVILGEALENLIAFMDTQPEAAICGPKLLNSNMTLQLPCRRGFPRFVNSVSHFMRLDKLFPKSKVLGSYLMTYMDSSIDHEVDAVSGACMLVRRNVLNTVGGLLDETYFMHFEDIDLCFRAKEHGYKVFYVHNSEVIHLKGQSSKLRSEGVTRNFFDSALIYFKKNYIKENFIAYAAMVLIIMCMKFFAIILIKIKSSGERKLE
jgi:GT2 family glycosyltransferase